MPLINHRKSLRQMIGLEAILVGCNECYQNKWLSWEVKGELVLECARCHTLVYTKLTPKYEQIKTVVLGEMQKRDNECKEKQ